ncbi:MAG: hypothetical protein GC185_00570 [Alphaproteobacteria bacterium]|nr:hypothetical protein [Alphaproteobacteria bacterium]
MPLDRPDDYADAKQWFSYFRLTKYLPAMPDKYKAEIDRAPTADAAKTVMTAYAAAALDVIFFVNMAPPQGIGTALEQTFGLHPNNLLELSVPELAVLAKVERDTLSTRLKDAGYKVSEGGEITGFTPPQKPAAAPRNDKRAP